MGPNRVFFPQQALDQWLSEAAVEVDGNLLVIKNGGRRYRLIEAVRVVAEVSGSPDLEELCGRVKSVSYLTELGAELLGDSMVMGDAAYDVVPGWMGTPVGSFAEHLAELGLPPTSPGTDEELLAQYLVATL
jgi:hypothetical protein